MSADNKTEIMTWTSLQEDVLSYCERKEDEDVIAQIPRCIMLAENRLASEIRGLGFLRIARGTMQSGNPVIEKPENWRESSSFHLLYGTKHITVFKRTYEYCRAYCEDTAIKRTPRYYSDYDFSHFFLVPSPDKDYDFELSYFERPAPLGAENETNWTTMNAPQLLLYATLIEAQVYLKNDQRAETFKGMYIQAAQAVLEESRRRELDRSSGQAA